MDQGWIERRPRGVKLTDGHRQGERTGPLERDAPDAAGPRAPDMQARVLAVLRDNEASLLRIARRHSLCADDAHDAVQRALEIYLRRAHRVEVATAGAWLRTVAKHEAMAIRHARLRCLPSEELDFDARPSDAARQPDERAIGRDRVARAAEALRECKPDEAKALLLLAGGNSYARISELTGWSYTKVNRCITEGRARFLRIFAAIEDGEACERWQSALEALVAGELRPHELSRVRSHLRNCSACRATLRSFYEKPESEQDTPPPATAIASPGRFPLTGAAEGGTSAGRLGRAWDGIAAIGEKAVGRSGRTRASSGTAFGMQMAANAGGASS